MPLAGNTTTTTTTTTMPTTTTATATLDHSPCRHDILPALNESQDLDPGKIDIQFDKSQCLFCAQMSQSMDQNLDHMSKTHGLHIDSTSLLVDIGSLLAHFHLVIFSNHQCIYCGTQRGSHLAVQHHMAAKGHCKYNLTGRDTGLRVLFDVSPISSEDMENNFATLYASDRSKTTYRHKSKNPRRIVSSEEPPPNSSLSLDHAASSPIFHVPTVAAMQSESSQTALQSLLSSSTRAMKQEHTLNSQLAQLRAEDKKNLAHLPASQQRALLLSQNKQTENARRSERAYQSNLESAGNRFNCLGKIRLIRKPPHTGNIHSLKRWKCICIHCGIYFERDQFQ